MNGQPVQTVVVYARDVQQETVRGNPDLTKLQLFSNFVGGGYVVGCSVARHPQSKGCVRHTHRGAYELFVVTAGEGIIEANGEEYAVSANDCVMVPPGVVHRLVGTSVADFVVICVFVVSPGHETDERPWAAVTSISSEEN